LSSKDKLLFWRDAAKCHIGPVVIVSPPPAACEILNLIERFKQVMGQPVVACRAVIALDISVLLRLARLDKNDAYGTPDGPGQRHSADVLRAVIAANDLGFATPFGDPLEYHMARQEMLLLRAEQLQAQDAGDDQCDAGDARGAGRLT